MSRTFHLFFHSPCFDGIVSAVLLSEFAERSMGCARVALQPVDYDVRSSWLKRSLPRHAGVVDFLYHPDAEIWFDHHASTFLNSVVRRRYEREPKPDHVYDPAAGSCAAVIAQHLTRERSFSTRRFRTLVRWADTIDSAAYARVSDAIIGKAAALQINRSLAAADRAYCRWLVQQLRRRSIADVAGSPRVRSRVRAVDREVTAGLQAFKEAARLEDGNIVVFQVDSAAGMVNRYAPYYLFPHARYSVGIVRQGRDAKLTAMRNPWKTFPSVPIGPLLQRFGGGGHHRVGSVLLKGRRSSAAPRILREVVGALKATG